MPNNEELQQALMRDVAAAEQTAAQGSQGRGTQVTPDQAFMPRAIRAQGRAMGEKELKENKQAVEDAIGELLSRTSITDETEQEKFKNSLRGKINEARMLSLRKAGELRVTMKRLGLDEAKQAQMGDSFGQLMANVGSMLISNLGSKKKASPPEGGVI